MIASGPIYDRVDAVLHGSDGYMRFRSGGMSLRDYAIFLDAARAPLVAGGVPDEDVDYAKRYPADRDSFLRASLTRLRANGTIDSDAFDRELIAKAQARSRAYDHGGRTTYIYPEESDLLAALVDIQRPRRIMFLGAYYGYWSAATLPALAQCGGTAILVDPDPGCCALASSNLAVEVASGLVEIACTTGEALLADTGLSFDMAVIDAELPRDHLNPALRGKGVYASLLSAALPHLTAGGLVVCHNILLDDPTGAPVFADILARNRCELGAFLHLARAELEGWTEIGSTEGVGVGRCPRIAP